ncbi:hypothetical protein HW555_004734 [Spodoptera exigua]|uniref:Uncharacterized protein n=1 Tax=Spodoptera exigua TaxID=7107 RepID=A0A835GLF2_SPOEX|nr:hypothetical protein HW555_004734 [Spodoptera exigua]
MLVHFKTSRQQICLVFEKLSLFLNATGLLQRSVTTMSNDNPIYYEPEKHSLIRLEMTIWSSICTELYREKNIDKTVLANIVRAFDVCTNSNSGMKASCNKITDMDHVYMRWTCLSLTIKNNSSTSGMDLSILLITNWKFPENSSAGLPHLIM